jgi:CheY-like chemotaxis protein
MNYVVRNASKGTVLVVDDTPEMQRYLRSLLELDSYRVEVAKSGHEALRFLRLGLVPDVILLDLQMPGIDGLETLRCLRDIHPMPRVIMCSALDNPQKIAEAASLGARAYLLKPIHHLYLSAAIERALGEESVSHPMDRLGSRPFVVTSTGMI